MIAHGSATKVHLLAGVTDKRRGFEGLFALARALLEADPLSGHVFGFCNRGRNRLKLLYWDGSGLWICAKRLERGRFSWPSEPIIGASDSRCVRMTQAELTLLINGIDISKSHKRDWYRVDKSGFPMSGDGR